MTTTFRSREYPALMLRVAGRRYKFVGGRITVPDDELEAFEAAIPLVPQYGIVRADETTDEAEAAGDAETGDETEAPTGFDTLSPEERALVGDPEDYEELTTPPADSDQL